MHKFGEMICKHRKLILIIALLLLIPSVIGMRATKINYDILVYLPEDVETIKGENILSEDFNMGAFSVVMIENMDTKDIIKLENKIKEIDDVDKAVSIADITGTGIPIEMIPDDIKEKVNKDRSNFNVSNF
jgi:predicted RND superfamily exporter protein